MTKTKRRAYVINKVSKGRRAKSAVTGLISAPDGGFKRVAVPVSMTVIPDLKDDATYQKLRAEAEEELRDDRRNAQRRAFRSLLGMG